MDAQTASYDSADLPNIFIDLVGRIGVELNDNIALLVGGLILALIVSIYLGLPQKAMSWLKSFSKQ